MKVIKKQILFILIFLGILIISNKVYGASTVITPSTTNTTPGTTVNIAVGVQSTEAWSLKLTSSGGTLGGTTSNADAADGETTKTVMNATFSATTAGTYAITLTGEVTGADLVKLPVNKSISITVAEAVQPPAQTQAPAPAPTQAPVLTFTSANETMYTTSEVRFRSDYNVASGPTLPKGTAVTRIGVSTSNAGGYNWSKVTYNGSTGYIASGFLSKTKPAETTPTPAPSPNPDEQKVNDATLKSLSLTGVELSPTFSPTVTSYTANVKADVNEVEVVAVASDEKAKVEIVGNNELKDGENVIVVTVTAEDGTISKYEIKLTKGEISVTPAELEIIGLNEKDEKIALSLGEPTIISSDTIEYTINLKEWLKSISILSKADAINIYEGTGTFDLVEGENKYTIISRKPDETQDQHVIEYRITINNPEKKVVTADEGEDENTKTKKIMIISAIVLVTIIGIVGVIIYYKKQHNDVDYGETDYSFLKNDEGVKNKEQETEETNKQEGIENEISDEKANYDIPKEENKKSRKKGGKHF